MKTQQKHIIKSIYSKIDINAKPEIIWDQITNVRIEQFSDPTIFKILGIPRPLKADLIAEGVGGKRIAYFENGKRFIQEITSWKPFTQYSFNFNPETGFIVGYFFDLSIGVFRIPSGKYNLSTNSEKTTLELSTTYSLDKKIILLFNIPVRLILIAFQNYLLKSIKKNSEAI